MESLACTVVYYGLQCRSTEWVSVWFRQTLWYTRAECVWSTVSDCGLLRADGLVY
jgi:hypothetical protein